MNKKPNSRKDKQEDSASEGVENIRNAKPFSLYPLTMEEALARVMSAPPVSNKQLMAKKPRKKR